MLQFERCTAGVAVYTSLLVTQYVLVTLFLATVSALRTFIYAADGIVCHSNLLGSSLHRPSLYLDACGQEMQRSPFWSHFGTAANQN